MYVLIKKFIYFYPCKKFLDKGKDNMFEISIPSFCSCIPLP